jgi:glucose-6-phosphate 1-dehydrogenase
MSQSPVLENPLKEGIRIERASEPCAMIIFGAHGDLTKRKLIPALYALYIEGFLPREFCVVGMSRTKMTHEEFRKAMRNSMQQFASDIPLESAKWERFEQMLYYLPGHFDQKGGLDELASTLKELSEKHGTQGNTLFYLSTPPSLYNPIIDRIQESGLASGKQMQSLPWPRIIVEKPFGHDLETAMQLDERLHQVFKESQIFRIDHYLGKETVQNIMVLRFANGIFEPIWNRQHIDHVQITNAETIGVEGRGAYYEEAGNMRDMIQNHMLQLVSLVGMEPPITLDAEAQRDEKAKVLRCIRPFDLNRLEEHAVRGQYGPGFIAGQQVPGYREEEKVPPNSHRETFTALKLKIDNWRWADVPFYVRSGKRLAKHVTEIAVHFKKAPHRLFNAQFQGAADIIGPNVLVLKIQPDEGVSLKFFTKQPGTATNLRWLSMDFNYGSAFGQRTPTAYERLIHDCIIGDASLFSRSDFVQASWELITPVLSRWDETPEASFPNYAAGTWGPPESDQLLAPDGDVWRSL